MSKLNLSLRALKKEDASAIAQLANNKKIWDNIRDKMPHPYTIEDAETFIDLKKNDDPTVTFGIILEGNICGLIGIDIQKDIYRKSAELGYWIGEPYWGRGVATEAVKQILKYGFENFDLERIYAAAFEYNIGSITVLKKNGFVNEGIARKAVYKNDAFYDEHQFGKLKSE